MRRLIQILIGRVCLCARLIPGLPDSGRDLRFSLAAVKETLRPVVIICSGPFQAGQPSIPDDCMDGRTTLEYRMLTVFQMMYL